MRRQADSLFSTSARLEDATPPGPLRCKEGEIAQLARSAASLRARLGSTARHLAVLIQWRRARRFLAERGSVREVPFGSSGAARV